MNCAYALGVIPWEGKAVKIDPDACKCVICTAWKPPPKLKPVSPCIGEPKDCPLGVWHTPADPNHPERTSFALGCKKCREENGEYTNVDQVSPGRKLAHKILNNNANGIQFSGKKNYAKMAKVDIE